MKKAAVHTLSAERIAELVAKDQVRKAFFDSDAVATVRSAHYSGKKSVEVKGRMFDIYVIGNRLIVRPPQGGGLTPMCNLELRK